MKFHDSRIGVLYFLKLGDESQIDTALCGSKDKFLLRFEETDDEWFKEIVPSEQIKRDCEFGRKYDLAGERYGTDGKRQGMDVSEDSSSDSAQIDFLALFNVDPQIRSYFGTKHGE